MLQSSPTDGLRGRVSIVLVLGLPDTAEWLGSRYSIELTVGEDESSRLVVGIAVGVVVLLVRARGMDKVRSRARLEIFLAEYLHV